MKFVDCSKSNPLRKICAWDTCLGREVCDQWFRLLSLHQNIVNLTQKSTRKETIKTRIEIRELETIEDGKNQCIKQQSIWMTIPKPPQNNSHKSSILIITPHQNLCITKLPLILLICHLVWKVITLTDAYFYRFYNSLFYRLFLWFLVYILYLY